MARRAAALVLAGAALTLAACSGSAGSAPSAAPSAAASTPATTEPSSSPAPTTSASPSLATLPASECLTGDWRLVRFVGASDQADQTYGTGQGGDVSVRFRGDGYTVSGAGEKPMTITLGGRTAQLRVDGRAEGTYALSGDTATFTQRSASGSGTLAAGGQSQKLSMQQVTRVVGLSGEGRIACTADAMTVTLTTVRLELGRP